MIRVYKEGVNVVLLNDETNDQHQIPTAHARYEIADLYVIISDCLDYLPETKIDKTLFANSLGTPIVGNSNLRAYLDPFVGEQPGGGGPCDPATILEPGNGYGIESAGVRVGDPLGTPTTSLASGSITAIGSQITCTFSVDGGDIDQRAYIVGLNQAAPFKVDLISPALLDSIGINIGTADMTVGTFVPQVAAPNENGVYTFTPDDITILDTRLVSSDYTEIGGFPATGYFEDARSTNQYTIEDLAIEDSNGEGQEFSWRGAGGSGEYELDDTELLHSDGSSLSTPRLDGALTDKKIPRVIITDSTDGDAVLYSGGSQGGVYDPTGIGTLSFSVTPAGGITPSGRLYMEAPKGGQTSTIYTGDEGWLEANSHQIFNPTRPTNPATIVYLTDFYTLGVNNIHGNTLRFTTTAGAATSGWVSGTYVWQDHAYGKMYRYDDVNQPLADHFADAAAATWEGKSAGDWAVCPVKLLHTMADGQDSLRPFSNIPIRPANIGTSSINQHTTSNCFNILNGSNNNLQINNRSVGSNNRVVYVTNI